ncbi:NCS1 family transporter [Ammoniphilus sp. 3BR4]|uniref:NCS1 family transporter n=1 Tax=Ammoniphilus sp. 3BR4 TaxID=3158265 RepID=UPI003465F7D1
MSQLQEKVDLDALNPIPEKDRPMGPVSYMMVMWSSAIIVQVMVIGTFLLKNGLNLAQTIWVGIVSAILVSIFMTLNGTAGIKYGIPFAIQARSSFGYKGAKLPHVLRTIPAIAWYGIGTWIGAISINTVMTIIFGTPDLKYLYFFLLIVLQTYLAYKGIKSIKWFDAVMSIIIFIMLTYFLWSVFANGKIDFNQYSSVPGSWGFLFWAGVAGAVANFSTVMLNSSDLVRHIKPATQTSNAIGNFGGIIPPWMFMVLSGMIIFMGTGNDDPIAALVALSPNPTFGIILLIFIILAQVTSNLTLNILPPALVFQDLFKMKWSTGVILTGILSFVSMPWVLFTSEMFFKFQNVYSSFLGPILGIMLADYWLLRKQRLNVTALYHEESGAYRYAGGISPAAYLAMFIGAAISFWQLEIAWLVGLPSGFVIYFILKQMGMERKYEQAEQTASGEAQGVTGM